MKQKVIVKNVLLLVALTTMLCGTGCHQEHQKHEEESTFLVTSPLRKDTSIINEYVCQIHAIQHIELRALEEGYLQNIYVDEGQFC